MTLSDLRTALDHAKLAMVAAMENMDEQEYRYAQQRLAAAVRAIDDTFAAAGSGQIIEVDDQLVTTRNR
jgi:hypothetical protein